jgi:uncharacterized repeat protein (TIGR01451 family)
LRPGQAIKLEAATETRDFLLKAKDRRVSVPGVARPGFVVGRNVAGDEVLLAASLTMAPGEYSVTVSATSEAGEERQTTLNVTLDPLQPVPSTATRPPVVLLNGWQFGILDSCPIATNGSADTFGSLEDRLTNVDHVPVVYFFDNCKQCRNCTIEALGDSLLQFLNLIQYDNGALVPQVDLVGHSMGGLIARAYLAGLQPDESLAPPANPRVRKLVEIAAPNFGSFMAPSNGTQTAEMVPGSLFLWSLATWNQGGDDLRGVDSLAIIGSLGTWSGWTNASDGVVSLPSASLSFARDDSRTRILPYCHIDSAWTPIDCTGSGIAKAAETSDIVSSFLKDTVAWTLIGTTPSFNVPTYGGLFVAAENATQYVGDLTQVQWNGSALTQNPQYYDVFYGDFLSAGRGTVTFTSTSLGPWSFGRTLRPGTYTPLRLKIGPYISTVTPLLVNTTGSVVQSGGTISVNGYGFGQQCSGCQVLAVPQGSLVGLVLSVSSWSDQAITAFLPATMLGYLQIRVNAGSAGQDSIGLMAAPLAAPTLSISKTHSGAFTQGQSGATYTVTVSNTASAGATSGVLTVTEAVPTGLTLISMAGGGWNCPSNTCTRSDVLNPGFSYPAITVTVNVAANAPSQVTNQVSVSGGGSAMANASDVTTIATVPIAAPVLTFPANGTIGVVVAPALTWNASVGAASYDVYFGTSSAPPFATNTTTTGYAPAPLNSGTTYYWQVVARNATGSAPSAVWSFMTGAAAVGLRFLPVTPCRVADTRGGAGPFGGPTIAGASSRSFAIPQSACGIPATAQAYSLNVTVVPEGHLSYLSLWPTGQSQPLVSTLNSFAGDVVANAAIVPAGSGGAVSVYVTDQTDVILDINGYFDASASSGAFSFYPATPCRVADTRGGAGTFGGPSMQGGTTRDFPVPLSGCEIPATAGGYSVNVTVVPPGYLGYLSTWPTGQAQPNVSTLNSWKGKVVANAAIVPTGTNESISVFASNPTDVILDINGYFGQPGHAGALSFYPVTPCRVADTRGASGTFGGPEMGVGGTSTRSFPIPASGCNIPSTAAAYSLNVTVVPDGALSYLSTWPTGSSQPLVSTLNSFDGSVVANAAIVPAGTNGAISVYVTNPTHVILDINGYFAP